jgi:hypothetical protein
MQWAQKNWFVLPFDRLTEPDSFTLLGTFLETTLKNDTMDTNVIDSFRGIEQDLFNEQLINRHPLILREAQRLGYSY